MTSFNVAAARHAARHAPGGADSLSGAYGPLVDSRTIERLDLIGESAARRLGGQAIIDYLDSTETSSNWASLPSGSAGVQVSGNKLYGVSGANPSVALVPFPVPAGTKATATTVITFVGGAVSTANVGFGIDTTVGTTPAANTPNGVGFVFVGTTATLVGFAGSNMTGLGTPPAGFVATNGVVYECTITIDEVNVSFAVRAVGSSTVLWLWTIKQSAITALGKSITNLFFFNQDSRALTGHAIGPFNGVITSQQPIRTKTIAGVTLTGLTHKDLGRYSDVFTGTPDPQRIQIPASYDPRRPAPVLIGFHQAGIGANSTTYPWIDSRFQPITKALGDAGYIVAWAQAGSTSTSIDNWGNTNALADYLSLYKYLRSHYNTSQLALLAVSMGGLPSLLHVAQRTLPNIAAFYGICNVVDASAVYTDNPGAIQSSMETAYGIAAGGSNLTTVLAGQNPMTASPTAFRGTPMRFSVVSDDAIVPPAHHATPFVAAVSPYVPEASVLTTASGGHLAAAAFSSSDLMTFLGKYVPSN